ncbi:MAG: EFR1 family ferrodoxin [Negativicutes bacterium]|jgi:ferredoxin/flavodoxin
MKIFYFSGTGNSLAIAKKIAAAFDAELINIASAMKNKQFVYNDEEIGLVFPLYCFGAPKMVCEFMKKLKTPYVDYLFTVCDGAGNISGMFLDEARRYLQGNIREISGYYLRSVTNYLPLGDIPAPEKIAAILAKTDIAVDKIIRSISARERCDLQQGALMKALNKTVLRLFKIGFEKNVHKGSEKFSVDFSCVGCGLCAKVCPAQNIKFETGGPEWLDRCEACMACIHWCPKRSIQLGSSAKKGRYHHPGITAEELFV